MKKLMLAAILLMNLQMFAQEVSKNNQGSNGKIYSSGYGAVSANYTRLNSQKAVFLGAYGGWMINHKLMIGVGGYGLISHNNGVGINPETNKQNKLGMGYGGLMVEYTFFEDRKIHFTANTLVGGGVITNGDISQDDDGNEDHWQHTHMGGYYVLQPSASIEISATDWLKIGVGGGYRLITGSNVNGISNGSLSAPTANLSFKFGGF